MINGTLSKYATHDNSAYPGLWRGCVGAWCPSLGPSGSRLLDYSGRQNWGTLTNMTLASAWGASSGAYHVEFDGVNDYVLLQPPINGLSKVSVSMWFWQGSFSSDDKLLMELTTNYNFQNAFIFDPNDSRAGVGMSFQVSQNTVYNGKWVPQPAAQTWHALTVVMDRNLGSSQDTVRVFLNAKEVGSQMSGAGNISGTFNSRDVYVACRAGSSLFAAIRIDDIRFYDRVLAVNEITTLARRRGIAFTPRTRRLAPSEQAAGGATPWLYARRSSRIIGGGVS